jgi:hypothetical protein
VFISRAVLWRLLCQARTSLMRPGSAGTRAARDPGASRRAPRRAAHGLSRRAAAGPPPSAPQWQGAAAPLDMLDRQRDRLHIRMDKRTDGTRTSTRTNIRVLSACPVTSLAAVHPPCSSFQTAEGPQCFVASTSRASATFSAAPAGCGESSSATSCGVHASGMASGQTGAKRASASVVVATTAGLVTDSRALIAPGTQQAMRAFLYDRQSWNCVCPFLGGRGPD